MYTFVQKIAYNHIPTTQVIGELQIQNVTIHPNFRSPS